MDIDDFRSILESSGVDVWTFIDTAITVAEIDYGSELKLRRDKIVEGLYKSGSCSRCRTLEGDVDGERVNGYQKKDGFVEKVMDDDDKHGGSSGAGHGGRGGGEDSPRSFNGDDEDDEMDPYGGLFDDEQKKILEIKQLLEDPDQSEDSLVDLLHNLAEMEITFSALKETDIGRHVNKLRKHPSNEVRRMVKHLVRKWKEIVDEWVRLHPEGGNASSGLMAYGDSPQQKFPPNGQHQGSDFAYSPNLHNGSSGSDRNNSEPDRKPKPAALKEAPARPAHHHSTPASASASASHSIQRQREQEKEANFDAERLASARKRLQANYKEAENAKKQRTIQVMGIHELPKPKKNRGGFQGRHW